MRKDNYWQRIFKVIHKGDQYTVIVSMENINAEDVISIRSFANEFYLGEDIAFGGNRDRIYEFIKHMTQEYVNVVFSRLYFDQFGE